MRAALYARFSTDEQREASITDQLRECERTAGAAQLEIVARFEDRGISGGTSQRPGYQAMLTQARTGYFEIIVTEDISRLWRNRAEFGPRSAELEDLGVHLLTCVGDDTRREGWGLVLGIKQAIAEHYRREVSYRTRRGLEGKALTGQSTGGKCYGYRDATAVDKDEAEIVLDIFRTYNEGLSAAAVAFELNTDLDPRPAPQGGRWGASTVLAILRNLRYTGAVEWGRSVCKGSAADSARKTRLVKPEATVSRHDESLRIVPQELWDAVQRRFASPTRRTA